MPDAALPQHTRSRLGLLFRVRGRSVWNRIIVAVREAPVRLTTAILLIGVVWIGLYGLFRFVFHQLEQTPLEAAVAVPMVFNFFFLAMLALLAFSNAIISYSALFGREESSYLLTLPVAPIDVVTLKYIESTILSSWSVVLLGMPLMFAMAELREEPTSRLLFLAFFLAFIPIPGALGLLLSWSIARFFPRSATRGVWVGAGVVLALLVVGGLRTMAPQDTDEAAEMWLHSFLSSMSFVEAAFLPNNWVAAGIDHALQGKSSTALGYLGVTIANAMFISWLVVRLVSKHFDVAYDRASASRATGSRVASNASGGIAGRVFFYLPLPLRLVAAKDLRTFFRDPAQWAQLTILFGLLVLYLTNMPTMKLGLQATGWMLMIPFLNLCAVSLILATFTCRFVFPLVSLEGQKLWLVGVLPVKRSRLLWSKLAFSMTVTLAVAVGAMGLAAAMLRMGPIWTVIHVGVTIGICFGLCGLSVGLGALLPMFDESNPARIANGLGGTTNLLISVAVVAVSLGGVLVATYRSRYLIPGTMPDAVSLSCVAGSVAVSVGAGLVALWVGGRKFDRAEV
jgi:ABC-2 type transport system permease protein